MGGSWGGRWVASGSGGVGLLTTLGVSFTTLAVEEDDDKRLLMAGLDSSCSSVSIFFHCSGAMETPDVEVVLLCELWDIFVLENFVLGIYFGIDLI